ncbi:hypothetical protein HD595_000026 [Nonomuraea roseoviolacea subsp. carminata]|uniref:Uncharacterized protein n=1 Tax=Nonomuraea roseoviolacea subsp. carminata TaxID=160689 RepID=A0ABT1JQC6_9ACTN|nr:hypothetical protein [Nonomuraea roseoviolacea subsp. carminata]
MTVTGPVKTWPLRGSPALAGGGRRFRAWPGEAAVVTVGALP